METKPSYEGRTRKYIVADDVHEYIKMNGGGKFLTEYFRKIMVYEAAHGLTRK